MFGDPVGNPKGWGISDLEQVIDVKHGHAFKSEYFAATGEYVLVTPGNFSSTGGYRDQGAKQKYFAGDFPSDYLLKKDDLLVAMTEQAAGLLGCPLFIPEDGVYLHNQRLGLVEMLDCVDKTYLYYLFNNTVIRQLIHIKATGTKVRHTSPSKIKEIRVGIPPLELQKEFARRIDVLDGLKRQAQKNLKNSTTLFNSLLQRAFKGELTSSKAA